jgi:hypothetical protein
MPKTADPFTTVRDKPAGAVTVIAKGTPAGQSYAKKLEDVGRQLGPLDPYTRLDAEDPATNARINRRTARDLAAEGVADDLRTKYAKRK